MLDFGDFSRDQSVYADLGEQNLNDLDGQVRLQWEPRWDNWDVTVHYVLAPEFGGNAVLTRNGALYPGVKTPPATWLNLTNTITDQGNVSITQTVDRLALGYTGPNFVVRVGRQALTWGAGLLFHPMDLIDPFAPFTVDTEYKPGVDMAYSQYLFDNGSDLQFVAVPRAASFNGPITSSESTLALHYHATIGQLGLTLLSASDHRDWTNGLGISGAWGGAAWNVEAIPTFEQDGTAKTSLLANINDGTTIFSKSATIYAEYYHNGFGVTGNHIALDTLPRDLYSRLIRGELFTSARDYLAGGMTYQYTGLLSLSPNLIVNLNDSSLFLDLEANWSLSDNVNLKFGVHIPVGAQNTEYGGLPVSSNVHSYFASPTAIFALLTRHF